MATRSQAEEIGGAEEWVSHITHIVRIASVGLRLKKASWLCKKHQHGHVIAVREWDRMGHVTTRVTP